jgi:hypothetical protein
MPVPLFIVKVAPLFVQAPELLYETGSPEEDAAATLNCVLKVAPAGACVVTMIVWFAFALVRLKAEEVEPPLMLARTE